MRQNARVIAAVAVPLLVLAVALSYLARNSGGAGPLLAVVVLVLGVGLTAASLLMMVRAEGMLDGLQAPESHAAALAAMPRLPGPSWWAPATGAALCVLLSGLFLAPGLAGFGGGLLAACLLVGVARAVTGFQVRRAEAAQPEAPAPLDRPTVSVARRIQAFAAEHGSLDETTAVISHNGRYGARIVLVGADGRLGDQVVPSVARAELACRLAGVTTTDSWSRELTASVHSTVAEWSFMGGQTLRPLQPAAAPATPA